MARQQERPGAIVFIIVVVVIVGVNAGTGNNNDEDDDDDNDAAETRENHRNIPDRVSPLQMMTSDVITVIA